MAYEDAQQRSRTSLETGLTGNVRGDKEEPVQKFDILQLKKAP